MPELEFKNNYDAIIKRRELALRNWFQQTQAGAFAGNFYTATYGLNNYIIAGANGEIQTALSGVVWTHRNAAAAYAGSFRCSTYGLNLVFLAGANGEIQTSADDGVTWVHRNADGGYIGEFRAATFGNGYIVLCGTNGEIQISNDGINFTSQVAAGGYVGDFRGATYSSTLGMFILVGTNGEIQTAPSTLTGWTHRNAAAGVQNLSDVLFANDIVIAVGNPLVGTDYGTIQTSPDGINYTNRTSALVRADNEFEAVHYDLGYFMLGGEDGEFQISKDYINWTRIPIPDIDVSSIASDGNNAIFVGEAGAIYRSLQI